MRKWMRELCEAGVDVDKIANKTFADVIKVIGVEAAIELFCDFHGTGIYVGTEYRRDLERQYLQKLSLGKTERELARKLELSAATINRLMNETVLTSKEEKRDNGYIPMFPELERDYPEEE